MNIPNIWRLNTVVQVSNEFFKYSELKKNMFSKISEISPKNDNQKIQGVWPGGLHL